MSIAKNLRLDFRLAEGDPERLPELTEALVPEKVSVIYASGPAAARAAQRAARTIPIIAVGSDLPCGHGPAKVSMVYPRRCCSASTKSSVCSCWQIGSSGSASGGKWPLPAALRVTASRHCSSTVRALVDFQRDRIRCFSTCRIRCCGARNSLIRERNSIASPDHNSIPKILKNNISGAVAGPVSGARA